MRFGRIEGVEAPVSRVVLGTMALSTERRDQAFELFDRYVELDGNSIDTAWVYQRGLSEAVVGGWLTQRGARDGIVLIGKGAATVDCTPELISSQLSESLDRLQTDSLDVYMMHRDNVDVPAAEFVDVLNEHLRAGRMRAFGGSNWQPERIAEANAYAEAHGLVGFTVSSPNFSLAVWNEPPWDDCCSASDPATRRWYQDRDIALLAWSSQASGFFTGRYDARDLSDPATAEAARVWFNEENFLRLERAREVAAKKGVTSTEIALAYVLCQPSNIFALIGPRNLDELTSSSAAAEVELSPEELAYLNLEA
jgi:aryl-alcohol dehydrogenase-like predicted oxidoreductase